MSELRIASLLASGTEIVCGLGLERHLVAISHECDFPPSVTSLPRVTSANINSLATSKAIDEEVRGSCATGQPLYNIDTERLAELRPNLIVTQAQCDVCAVRLADVLAVVEHDLSLRSCRVASLNPTRLSHVYDDIRRVADACGAASQAQSYIGSLSARVEAVVSRATGVVADGRRPRVACIEWIEPMMIAANWMPDLIEAAGGQCHLTQSGEHGGYTDWHEVRAFDPEVIVVMPCGFDLERSIRESEVLPQLSGWSDVSAVRSGRVFAVDGNALFNRSGPRMVDSLELLAGLLHPEAFAAHLDRLKSAWQNLKH